MDPTKSEYAGVVEIWAPDTKATEEIQAAINEDKVWASLLENATGFIGTEVIGVEA